MPKKRSERIKEVKVPSPVQVERKGAAEVVAAICPTCGRTIPSERALKVGSITVGKVGYFDSIDWDEAKPFGVAYQANGRGSFRYNRHIGPEEAPELFEALKARLKEAVREWRKKGWFSSEDIE